MISTLSEGVEFEEPILKTLTLSPFFDAQQIPHLCSPYLCLGWPSIHTGSKNSQEAELSSVGTGSPCLCVSKFVTL